jgi:hypothetical protein
MVRSSPILRWGIESLNVRICPVQSIVHNYIHRCTSTRRPRKARQAIGTFGTLFSSCFPMSCSSLFGMLPSIGPGLVANCDLGWGSLRNWSRSFEIEFTTNAQPALSRLAVKNPIRCLTIPSARRVPWRGRRRLSLEGRKKQSVDCAVQIGSFVELLEEVMQIVRQIENLSCNVKSESFDVPLSLWQSRSVIRVATVKELCDRG